MLLWSNTVLMLVFLFCFYHSWFEIINNNKVALMFGGFTRCIHIWLSAKRCANGGSDFWLSIKSVSNTLSCCCFVFIIGQYHSGNNMSSKSGAAGEILFFESEKCHKIRPLKTDTLTVSAFDAFIHVHDESKHYLCHRFAQRRYHFTQCI